MPLPQLSYERYIPARIRKMKHRWDIIFYQTNPHTSIREVFRRTYGLNRISNMKMRSERAEQLVEEINTKLPMGWPFIKQRQRNDREMITLYDAIMLARKIKLLSPKRGTIRTYRSCTKIFLEYIEERGMSDWHLLRFGKQEGADYMDWLRIERGLSNNGYNNRLMQMKALFQELENRQYLDAEEHPFRGIKPLKATAKKRRAFSQSEATIVSKAIKRQDKFLHLAVLLQYFCFIRPAELLELKPWFFDLKLGVIRLPGSITKNGNTQQVTIPNALTPVLQEIGIEKAPEHSYLFGAKGQFFQAKSVGFNYLRNRHKEILDKMKRGGGLTNFEGLYFYSWKDTGAIRLFHNKVDIREIQKQMRHKDLSYTQRYCESLYIVNREIKALGEDLI